MMVQLHSVSRAVKYEWPDHPHQGKVGFFRLRVHESICRSVASLDSGVSVPAEMTKAPASIPGWGFSLSCCGWLNRYAASSIGTSSAWATQSVHSYLRKCASTR